MQKRTHRFWLITILVLVLALVPAVAGAASETHEGVMAKLTLDKQSYKAGEKLNAQVEVRNTNAYEVQNVRLTLTLPEGVSLAEGIEEKITIDKLAAGEMQTYTYVGQAAAANKKGDGTTKTGDDALTVVFAVLAIGAVACGLWLLRKKRAGMQLICLLVCAAVVIAGVLPSKIASAKVESADFEVTEAVQVAGKEGTVKLAVAFDKATLTGTAEVVGTLAFGEELRVEISGIEDAEEADICYQWMRDGVPIEGATKGVYTVCQDDIGTTLSCEVTSSAIEGSATAEAKGIADKAEQAAPVFGGEGSGADVEVFAGVEKITVVNNHAELELEYSIDDGQAWIALLPGEEDTKAVTDGNYEVRLRYIENDTHKESSEDTVDVTATYPELGGTATLEGTLKFGETLNVNTDSVTTTGTDRGTFSYQWQRDGVDIADATNASYTLVQADIDAEISCEVTSDKASDSVVATTSSTIAKAEQATPTFGTSANVTVTGGPLQITIKNNKTGYTLSYKIDGGTWATLAGGSSTNVAATVGAHTVEVYYGETDTHNESPTASIEATVINPVLSGSASISGTPKYGSSVSVNTSGITGAASNTFKYQWKRGSTNIGTNSSSYAITEADIGKTITCVVTSTYAGGSVTSSGVTGAKADQAAPTSVVVACTSTRVNEVNIVNRSTTATLTVQYSLYNTSSWSGSQTIQPNFQVYTITGVSSGIQTVYVRYPETATHNASPAYGIQVDVK